jgi:hypothetical protein
MLLRAHDNCGATSMGQDVSADRAQEHSGEPAVTSITHNQKLSTVRSIDESLSGVSLHRSFSHRLGEAPTASTAFRRISLEIAEKSTPIMDTRPPGTCGTCHALTASTAAPVSAP